MSVEDSVFLNRQPITGRPGTERVDITCTSKTVYTLDKKTALGNCLSSSLAALGIAHARITDMDLLTVGSPEIVSDHLNQFRSNIGHIARSAADQIGTIKPIDHKYFSDVLDDISHALPAALESDVGFIETIGTVVEPLCKRIPSSPIITVRGRAPALEAEYENRLAALTREPRPYDSAKSPYRSLYFNISRHDLDLTTTLAILDDTSVASQLRAALEWYFELRFQDPELDAKIQERKKELEQ